MFPFLAALLTNTLAQCTKTKSFIVQASRNKFLILVVSTKLQILWLKVPQTLPITKLMMDKLERKANIKNYKSSSNDQFQMP